MRITKRLPFGFRGDWGKLYKRYTSEKELAIDESVITYANDNYVAIGQAVQFKKVMDEAKAKDQSLQGVMENSEYVTAQTTDAYWDDEKKEHFCVVAPDDIVQVFGRYWIVLSVRTKSTFSPAEHKFFYLELQRINLGGAKL